MSEQLDLFRQPTEPVAAIDPDPEPQPSTPLRPRTQLTELPGSSFEDIFIPPEAA